MEYFKVAKKIEALIQVALKSLNLPEIAVHLEHPADPAHGDYATNVAMVAFANFTKAVDAHVNEGSGAKAAQKRVSWKNPRSLAEVLVQEIKKQLKNNRQFVSVTVAGAGFINFTLSEDFLLEGLKQILSESTQLVPQINSGKKIVVEFTDPNPFKQFHIGHLYSNTVGESICRLLEATGATVRRANYYGDVGMHVAKSIWGMREKIFHEEEENIAAALKNWAERPLAERAKFLGEAYAFGATAFKTNEKVKIQITQLNKLLYQISQEIMVEERGWEPLADYAKHLDPAALDTWDVSELKLLYQTGKAWSLAYFESIYQRVGMSFDNFYPESVVAEYGLDLVHQGLKTGIFTKSQGAVVFAGEKLGLHTRVFINSAGLPTYETKELGLAPVKYEDEPYDASLIITGNEINEYFQVLLAAMKAVKPELGAKTTHLGHGMVRLPSGKMSSRTGEIITGEWLLDEAASRIQEVLRDDKKDFTDSQRSKIAEQVGQAAIKYTFLKSNIGKDIAFNFNESLSFAGNSGPYLQYTYVRCQAVLKKALSAELNTTSFATEPSTTQKIFTAEFEAVFKTQVRQTPQSCYLTEEIELLRNLYQYFEVVVQAAANHAPHLVCTYLYQLAQSFNTFYTKLPILQAQTPSQKQFRLALTQATAIILGQGLDLLNISLVEEM